MNYEEFKDEAVEDVRRELETRTGKSYDVQAHTVEKMNENYDAITVKPEDGKELMTMDELAVMDGGKCILQLRGVGPFLSDKYDVTQHPHYKETGEYDKKNNYDIAGNLNPRMSLKDEDLYDVVEA